MHTPQDAQKSVWAVRAVQILVYTLTGSVTYRFVSQNVASPALLSNPGVVPRIVFGIAISVIFKQIHQSVYRRPLHPR